MDRTILVGEIVDDTQVHSLLQLCAICGVQAERVQELVSFGILEPAGDQPAVWAFSASAVHRAKKALRLHRDLGVDHQGLALALELLDEIDRLRGVVARLQR